jgi:hypothetical protein
MEFGEECSPFFGIEGLLSLEAAILVYKWDRNPNHFPVRKQGNWNGS